MALLKKKSLQTAPFDIQISAELRERLERVTASADAQGMVFDLQTTLVRAIRAELTRAESVLNGRGRQRSKSAATESAET
jgi:hypothetical protein